MEAAWGIGGAGLIVGLVQVAKQLGLPARLGGAVSVLLGALLGVAWAASSAAPVDVTLADSILAGVATGLVSSGAWSTTKNARDHVVDSGG